MAQLHHHNHQSPASQYPTFPPSGLYPDGYHRKPLPQQSPFDPSYDIHKQHQHHPETSQFQQYPQSQQHNGSSPLPPPIPGNRPPHRVSMPNIHQGLASPPSPRPQQSQLLPPPFSSTSSTKPLPSFSFKNPFDSNPQEQSQSSAPPSSVVFNSAYTSDSSGFRKSSSIATASTIDPHSQAPSSSAGLASPSQLPQGQTPPNPRLHNNVRSSSLYQHPAAVRKRVGLMSSTPADELYSNTPYSRRFSATTLSAISGAAASSNPNLSAGLNSGSATPGSQMYSPSSRASSIDSMASGTGLNVGRSASIGGISALPPPHRSGSVSGRNGSLLVPGSSSSPLGPSGLGLGSFGASGSDTEDPLSGSIHSLSKYSLASGSSSALNSGNPGSNSNTGGASIHPSGLSGGPFGTSSSASVSRRNSHAVPLPAPDMIAALAVASSSSSSNAPSSSPSTSSNASSFGGPSSSVTSVNSGVSGTSGSVLPPVSAFAGGPVSSSSNTTASVSSTDSMSSAATITSPNNGDKGGSTLLAPLGGTTNDSSRPNTADSAASFSNFRMPFQHRHSIAGYPGGPGQPPPHVSHLPGISSIADRDGDINMGDSTISRPGELNFGSSKTPFNTKMFSNSNNGNNNNTNGNGERERFPSFSFSSGRGERLHPLRDFRDREDDFLDERPRKRSVVEGMLAPISSLYDKGSNAQGPLTSNGSGMPLPPMNPLNKSSVLADPQRRPSTGLAGLAELASSMDSKYSHSPLAPGYSENGTMSNNPLASLAAAVSSESLRDSKRHEDDPLGPIKEHGLSTTTEVEGKKFNIQNLLS